MALPTAADLKTVAFAKAGAPFIRVAAKTAINLDELDAGYQGGPFWGLGGGAAPPVVTRVAVSTTVIT